MHGVSFGQRKSPQQTLAGLDKEPVTFRVTPGEEGLEGGGKSQARLKRVDDAAGRQMRVQLDKCARVKEMPRHLV